MPTARIKNASGFLLIDLNFFNLALRSKGTIVTGAKPPGNTASIGEITLPHDQSVLAFAPSAPACLFSSTYGQGTVTHRFLASNANTTIEYFSFDLPEYPAVNPNHAKLILRNPNTGRKIFDSRIPYLRVVEVVNFDAFDTSFPMPKNFNYPGKKLAVVQSKRAYDVRSEIIPGNPAIVVSDSGSSMAMASGPNASIYKMNGYSAFTAEVNPNLVYPNTTSTAGCYLLIDVTNF